MDPKEFATIPMDPISEPRLKLFADEIASQPGRIVTLDGQVYVKIPVTTCEEAPIPLIRRLAQSGNRQIPSALLVAQDLAKFSLEKLRVFRNYAVKMGYSL